MRNGPFQALQDMYLFDSMTGTPRPGANPKLLELAMRQRAEQEMLNRLKQMRIKAVNSIDWEQCCNISFESGQYDITTFLSMLASKLVYDCRQPLEMAKSDNQLWVRTG